jgi:hypothetical protein
MLHAFVQSHILVVYAALLVRGELNAGSCSCYVHLVLVLVPVLVRVLVLVLAIALVLWFVEEIVHHLTRVAC